MENNINKNKKTVTLSLVEYDKMVEQSKKDKELISELAFSKHVLMQPSEAITETHTCAHYAGNRYIPEIYGFNERQLLTEYTITTNRHCFDDKVVNLENLSTYKNIEQLSKGVKEYIEKVEISQIEIKKSLDFDLKEIGDLLNEKDTLLSNKDTELTLKNELIDNNRTLLKENFERLKTNKLYLDISKWCFLGVGVYFIYSGFSG